MQSTLRHLQVGVITLDLDRGCFPICLGNNASSAGSPVLEQSLLDMVNTCKKLIDLSHIVISCPRLRVGDKLI